MKESQMLLNLSKQIKALSEAGIVYKQNEYDLERYEQLREIALQMQSILTNTNFEILNNFYLAEKDYPTPKIDVRAFIVDDTGRVLLVRETIDQKWTLPGGWADIGLTPTENVIKEVEEETGLQVEVKRLLAVYDKKCHPHPPQAHYVYKLIFLCKKLGGDFDPNFDISGVDYFKVNDLPELSEDRILEQQLKELSKLAGLEVTHCD